MLAHMRPGATVPAEVAGDARIQWLSSDLHDAAALARSAAGASVVVHALNPTYTHKAWQAQVLPMTDAALSVTRALDATLMVVANVYNFGIGMPSVLREDTPQRAQTVKGRIRIAMEQKLAQSGVRTIVIRAGDFFGSGKGTWFDQAIVKDLHKGRFTYPGPRTVPTAWAYLPDLARTFVAVAARREQLSTYEVLHFAGRSITGQQWRYWNLLATGLATGRRCCVSATCHGRSSGSSLFVPTWAALAEMRYLWNTPHALANDKLVRLIGVNRIRHWNLRSACLRWARFRVVCHHAGILIMKSAILKILSLGVAIYAMVAYGFLPGIAGAPQMSKLWGAVGIYIHIFTSVVAGVGTMAILGGPAAAILWHRWSGRTYLIAGVLPGGISGLYVARFAFGGWVSETGFLWPSALVSAGLAYKAIRRGKLASHQRWMLRNFALTFAAVTLRIYLGSFAAVGVPFEVFYPWLAWACWVPNLIAIHWFILQKGDLHATT